MKLKPAAGRLLVVVIPPEDITRGGIILPESRGDNKPTQGVILPNGIGPPLVEFGVEIKVNFKEEQRVIFNRYAGTEIKIGDLNLLVLKHSDVMCSVEE